MTSLLVLGLVYLGVRRTASGLDGRAHTLRYPHVAPLSAEAGPHRVVLHSAGPQKIAVIKLVRQLTGVGLAEAKNMAERTPSVILDRLSESDATRVQGYFAQLEAEAQAE